MTHDHTLSIEIPDFSCMPDEEVAAHPLTRVRDGRWSALTWELLERFETDKLDLNDAWADTWQRWECPCCLRAKREIARRTADGVLLCRIDLHHDHLTDYAKTLFQESMVAELPDNVTRMRTRARSTAYPLIQRFTETLVCADCNQADANMKAAIGSEIPAYFSFSPEEIAQFIKPRPNKAHAIDQNVGSTIWKHVRPSFEDRAEFTRMLVERIGAGKQDIEVGPTPYGLQQSEVAMLYDLAHRAAGVRSNFGRMFEGLRARSRATDGNRSKAGRKLPRKVVAPTRADFDAVNERNASSRPWVTAGPGWQCPICERSKFEITRKSNKGAWMASVHYLCTFVDEADPENQVRRAQNHCGPILLRSHHRYSLCQDCRHVVTEASKAVPGTNEYCFRPGELRALIGEPTPHSLHTVHPASIRDAVWANIEWIEATRDYWAHLSEAMGIYSDVHIRLTRGFEPREAERLVFDAYITRCQIEDPGYERLTWLLREGARFARENR